MNRFRTALCLWIAAAGLALAGDEIVITPEKKAHWAWKAPARPALPSVKNAAWVRNPIDHFVLAKLEEKGLAPSAPADPAVLLRRLYFDLIGLPPTPGELEEFVQTCGSHGSYGTYRSYEGWVERLLASPHYGERWGRHWLDLARYAESNGYEFDEIRPDAWRYRDYVIRAFNADKPFHRFILEQLAGDELWPDDADARIATGFNLLGPDMTDSSNQAQRRQNTLDDMTETAGLAFLGLTIGCARCHDHKFEPIFQADFYRMQAFFAPAVFRKDVPVASKEQLANHARAQDRYQKLIQPTLDALAKLEEPCRVAAFEKKLALVADEARVAHQTPAPQRTPRQRELVDQTARLVAVGIKDVIAVMTADDRARHEQLEKTLKTFDKEKPPALPTALGLQDAAGPVAKTFLLDRGELNRRGDEIQPAWPLILSPGLREVRPPIEPPTAKTTGRRTALARWIASPQHPLTARVLVNRLWQHHFGRGIVATASDFGVRGEAPTHPELLDWLATEFVERGWSVKQMHRLMVRSATYQQGSRLRLSASLAKPQAATSDSDNTLLWRMNRRRLEAEIIRDSLLAVSGRLNDKMGGPSVFVTLPAEAKVSVKEWPVSPDPDEHRRRSVYLFARRNLKHPFLETFDLPDTNQSCAKRQQSTTGPQALALLNSGDVTAAAHAMAKRLQAEVNSDDARIDRAFRIAFARPASADELRGAREFLREASLSELCRALLNANEFVYVD